MLPAAAEVTPTFVRRRAALRVLACIGLALAIAAVILACRPLGVWLLHTAGGHL